MDHTLRWQKSTFSDGGEGNTCVELAVSWQKSTFSDGGNGNTCVEVAASPATLHLRESDAPATVLTTCPTALAHLLAGIRQDAAR
ncbi:protein of unknown function [Streptomyces sp. yr375]|uniref:DUF397 domain-containing protein n=1 Tax=Streptomyces sp. yr375 TaxID=1761906 RepID=UPI0008C9D9A9|nr:DUF397 domain-containing protein [Streptomyces sp. yr375]SER42484.1 protein of unknown function [Streptomyces sp. yr375]